MLQNSFAWTINQGKWCTEFMCDVGKETCSDLTEAVSVQSQCLVSEQLTEHIRMRVF